MHIIFKRRKILAALCLMFLLSYAEAQVTSTFVSNAENWTTPNDADGTISYSATGGNPGGFVFGSPFVINLGAGSLYVPFNFVAPPTYLGNRSSYYNGTLRYDIQVSTAGIPNQLAEVTIADNSGITLYYFPSTSNIPAGAPTWTTFSVPLNNALGYWKTTNNPAGAAATEAQVLSILTDLATLQIRGLYRDANVTSRLDNVTFMPPLVITTQPVSRIVCDGITTSLITVATGNASINYQWQKQNTPPIAGWTDLTNVGGYNGTLTSSLSVNTTGNFGGGIYRCKISGIAVADVFTTSVTITVNANPSAPLTTGNTSCGAASLSLVASGGIAGQYRWYTVPSGGTAIAGQTNGTYITPIVATTTTYYVSINNGTCESTRTAVNATILPTPPKPSITASELISAGIVQLCLKPITLSAPAGFTYTWSSGEITQQITTMQPGNYSVTIKDVNGCSSVSSDIVQVVANSTCINNPPVINTALLTTTIGGFVSIDLTTHISDPDNNLDPSSLQIVGGTTQQGGKATLTGFVLDLDYSSLSFSGSDFVTLRICDQLNVCIENDLAIEVIGEINIYNGISPNGDKKNDTWVIENIDLLPDTQYNQVTIYNRWGDVVWEDSRNYDNSSVVFTGLNKNGSELSTGSYFYKIDLFKDSQKTEKTKTLTGYLSLKR